MLALPGRLPARLMVTTIVTLCPARRTPSYPLSVMAPDEVAALQVAGPPCAVSTIVPADPEPTSSMSGVAVSAPRPRPGLGGGDGCPVTWAPGTRGGSGPGP